jgi:tetratricopeptide (TPR) repeat protein
VTQSGVREHRGMQTISFEVVLWIARLFFLAMLLASPWYYGSVSWLSQSVYVPLVMILFVLSVGIAAVQGHRWGNPFVWSLLGLLAIAVFQTVPLPGAIWKTVSAGVAFDRKVAADFALFSDQLASSPATASESQMTLNAVPRTLSVHWIQTRASASTFAMSLAWIISASILFRTQKWELVLTIALGAGGLAIATLGLVQLVAWNDWTLLPMPTSTFFSTFVNRNSAPQFLAVGLGGFMGTLVWWSYTKSDHTGKKYDVRYPAVNLLARMRRRLDDLVIDIDSLSIVLIIATTILFVATLASASRGGIVACCAASVVTLVFSLNASRNILRTVALVTVITSIGLLLLTSLDLDDAIVERIATMDREAYQLDNGRFTLWSMILSNPSLWINGCGLGNFHFAILPTYRTELNSWFYHAESLYLELLTDFGVIGFAIAICGLAWLVWRIGQCLIQKRLYAPTMLASIFAISAIGLQSLVDFSLILPGVFLPAGGLVGCFLGRCDAKDYGRKNRKEKQQPRRDESEQPQKQPGLTFWLQPFTALFILAVGLAGLPALRGFAMAEKVGRELDEVDKEIFPTNADGLDRLHRILNQLDRVTIDKYSWHPEVNLQLARGMQAYSEKLVEDSSDWDGKWDKRLIAALSKPEAIAAAFRAKSSVADELEELKRVADRTQARQLLADSAVRMKTAAEACSFDWRPAWGLFRSDLNLLKPESRALNLARLANLSNISNSMPAKIGSSCLIAGERQTAFTLIKRYLDRSPNMSGRISEGLVHLIDKDELLQLLPKSPLVIASVAEQLSKLKPPPKFIESFVGGIDLEEVVAEAKKQRGKTPNHANNWMTVQWLAQKQDNMAVQLEALRQYIQADPMRHDLRARFANLLADASPNSVSEKRKQIEEAISQAESAFRLAPDNGDYKKLVAKLRATLSTLNNSPAE